MPDPYASSVVCHLPGNLNDGPPYFTNQILDYSDRGGSPDVIGPAISSSQFKYGNASIYCGVNDSTGNYLRFWNWGALTFALLDFTIETWVYLTSYSSTWGTFIYDGRNAALTDFAPTMTITTLASGANLSVRLNPTTTFVVGGGPISLNTWHHVAMQRSSGTLEGFVDGVTIGTIFDNTTSLGCTRAPSISYSSNQAGTTNISGYIDDFRITRGVARYTSPFTPPTAIEYSPLTLTSRVGMLDPISSTTLLPYYARPGQISGAGPNIKLASNYFKETPPNYGGDYKITGTVQKAGSLPYLVNVLVFPEDAPSKCIASSYTNPTTGAYTVNHLAAGNYIVLGVDPTGTYNDVVYSLVPSVPM